MWLIWPNKKILSESISVKGAVYAEMRPPRAGGIRGGGTPIRSRSAVSPRPGRTPGGWRGERVDRQLVDPLSFRADSPASSQFARYGRMEFGSPRRPERPRASEASRGGVQELSKAPSDESRSNSASVGARCEVTRGLRGHSPQGARMCASWKASSRAGQPHPANPGSSPRPETDLSSPFMTES